MFCLDSGFLLAAALASLGKAPQESKQDRPSTLKETIRSGREAESRGRGREAVEQYIRAVLQAPDVAGDYATLYNYGLPHDPTLEDIAIRAMWTCVGKFRENPNESGISLNLAFLLSVAPVKEKQTLLDVLSAVGISNQELESPWERVSAGICELLSRVIERDPKNALAYAYLGIMGGGLDRGRKAFHEAIRLDPGNLGFEFAAARGLGEEDRLEAQELIRKVFEGAPEGSYHKDYSRFRLASFEVDAGRYEEAFQLMGELDRSKQDVHQYDIGDLLVRIAKGFYSVRSDYSKAITVYERALLWRDDWMVLNGLGNAYYKNGEYERAKNILLRAGKSVDHYTLSMCYYRLGSFYEAAECMERWDFLNFQNQERQATIFLDIGTWWMKAKQFDRAVSSSLKSIELNPKDSKAHYWLGMAYYSRGDLTAAVEAFTRASELAPDSAGCFEWIGAVQYLRGDLSSALEAHMRAKERAPSEATHWLEAACCLVELGRADDAIRFLKEAVERFPENADLASWLGEAYNRKGDNREGTRWQNRAQRLSPTNHREAEEAVRDFHQKGQEAERAGNLYMSLQYYTQSYRRWAGVTLREQQRESIFRVFEMLPAKPLLPPGAFELARKAEAAVEGGDFLNAERWYEQAVGVAPWGAEMYFNLAIVQGAQMMWERAKKNMGHYKLLVDDPKFKEIADQWIKHWNQEREAYKRDH